MTLLKGVTNQNRLLCETDQELCPPNACRLTVQEVRAWQRLMDSDWWTLKNLEPGYCSNWLSNGWSLIELSSALKAWRPHEQRLRFEISSSSDSYFDEKIKSFFHGKLAFVVCTLAKHWGRKAREQSKGKPRDRGWETEMSQMFWIQVKGRGESCESSNKTLGAWKGSSGSWILLASKPAQRAFSGSWYHDHMPSSIPKLRSCDGLVSGLVSLHSPEGKNLPL